ncbi:unnamed protein product [Urochloa humidicola]
MASATSTVHQKAVVAVCFMLMILLCTGPSSAMAASVQPNCTAACDSACRAYGVATCRSVNDVWCQTLQECQDQVYRPCSITCNQRCNSSPIQC